MTESCGQGDGGSEERKLKMPRDPSEAENSRWVKGRPVVIYTDSPKPIHVEAQDFKNVVQRLTGKARKRRANNYSVQEHSASHSSESSCKSQEASESSTPPQQLSSGNSKHALEEYLDRLDKENPSPQPSPNLGLFPTAGLVKGVDLELGLQWNTVPGSVEASSSRTSESLSVDAIELKDNPDGD